MLVLISKRHVTSVNENSHKYVLKVHTMCRNKDDGEKYEKTETLLPQ